MGGDIRCSGAFKSDELLGFVDEVYWVLRSGGTWIINVQNGESPLIGRISHGDITHHLAFTLISIAQVL